MKTMFIIQIGHHAYRGDNAYKLCRSKAAAVRELHSRGVLRNAARAAVNKVCEKPDGYIVVYVGKDMHGALIEVTNRTHDINVNYTLAA